MSSSRFPNSQICFEGDHTRHPRLKSKLLHETEPLLCLHHHQELVQKSFKPPETHQPVDQNNETENHFQIEESEKLQEKLELSRKEMSLLPTLSKLLKEKSLRLKLLH